MQISSRFTIAIHIFVCINTFKNEKITSDFLATSTNVNPVIIRKILSQLKKANLINVVRGTGGTTLAKSAKEITLLDIYYAVEPLQDDQLFNFHANPNIQCPVGKNIHNLLDDKLFRVQQAMENELQATTLNDVFMDMDKYL